MEDPPTCGQGLAEHAALPASLGALTAAVAGVLEAHLDSLDLEEEHGRQEHAAYTALIQDHRNAAATLEALARRMASYRDLPMASHDIEKLMRSQAVEAFRSFVAREEELVALLWARLEREIRMACGVAGLRFGIDFSINLGQ